MEPVLLVGLGNPGPRYAATRHNIGFRWVDGLVARLGSGGWKEKYKGLLTDVRLAGRRVDVLKPLTYMNRSGNSVQAAMAGMRLTPDRIWIAHDDLDLPFGTIRLKVDGGHGGNNGIRSVIDAIGRTPYRRIRFGIGHPGKGADVVSYVLAPFDADEEERLPDLIERATRGFEKALEAGIEEGTRWLHTQTDEI